jgi:hypothetical protein
MQQMVRLSGPFCSLASDGGCNALRTNTLSSWINHVQGMKVLRLSMQSTKLMSTTGCRLQ